jgi:hypothetical protein
MNETDFYQKILKSSCFAERIYQMLTSVINLYFFFYYNETIPNKTNIISAFLEHIISYLKFFFFA